ncbi:hypothetical protein BD779DRAFT_1492251, partial [Infundibulicybe gibba]
MIVLPCVGTAPAGRPKHGFYQADNQFHSGLWVMSFEWRLSIQVHNDIDQGRPGILGLSLCSYKINSCLFLPSDRPSSSSRFADHLFMPRLVPFAENSLAHGFQPMHVIKPDIFLGVCDQPECLVGYIRLIFIQSISEVESTTKATNERYCRCI